MISSCGTTRLGGALLISDVLTGWVCCVCVATPVLLSQPFYEALHRALRVGGLICTQAESLWLHMDVIKSLASMCKQVGHYQYYQCLLGFQAVEPAASVSALLLHCLSTADSRVALSCQQDPHWQQTKAALPVAGSPRLFSNPFVCYLAGVCWRQCVLRLHHHTHLPLGPNRHDGVLQGPAAGCTSAAAACTGPTQRPGRASSQVWVMLRTIRLRSPVPPPLPASYDCTLQFQVWQQCASPAYTLLQWQS